MQEFKRLRSVTDQQPQRTAGGQWLHEAVSTQEQPRTKSHPDAAAPQRSTGAAAAASIHAMVAKRFDGVLYIGTVVGYDTSTGWYRVLYGDSDGEELTAAELASILVQPMKTSIPDERKARRKDL